MQFNYFEDGFGGEASDDIGVVSQKIAQRAEILNELQETEREVIEVEELSPIGHVRQVIEYSFTYTAPGLKENVLALFDSEETVAAYVAAMRNAGFGVEHKKVALYVPSVVRQAV